MALLLLLQSDVKLPYRQVIILSCSFLLQGDSRFQVVSRMHSKIEFEARGEGESNVYVTCTSRVLELYPGFPRFLQVLHKIVPRQSHSQPSPVASLPTSLSNIIRNASATRSFTATNAVACCPRLGGRRERRRNVQSVTVSITANHHLSNLAFKHSDSQAQAAQHT